MFEFALPLHVLRLVYIFWAMVSPGNRCYSCLLVRREQNFWCSENGIIFAGGRSWMLFCHRLFIRFITIDMIQLVCLIDDLLMSWHAWLMIYWWAGLLNWRFIDELACVIDDLLMSWLAWLMIYWSAGLRDWWFIIELACVIDDIFMSRHASLVIYWRAVMRDWWFIDELAWVIDD